MSIIVPYIFSHDHILEAVKQESSLYAERKIAGDGQSLFEQFVFDEEYFRKFRELFFDAQAKVMDRYGAYMQYAPETDEQYFFEESDFSIDRDFSFSLLMPDDYNQFYNKQVSIKKRIPCVLHYVPMAGDERCTRCISLQSKGRQCAYGWQGLP
jgi:hypothetical protein